MCVCVIWRDCGVNEGRVWMLKPRSGPGEDKNRPSPSAGPLLNTHIQGHSTYSIYSLHCLCLSLQPSFCCLSIGVFLTLYPCFSIHISLRSHFLFFSAWGETYQEKTGSRQIVRDAHTRTPAQPQLLHPATYPDMLMYTSAYMHRDCLTVHLTPKLIYSLFMLLCLSLLFYSLYFVLAFPIFSPFAPPLSLLLLSTLFQIAPTPCSSLISTHLPLSFSLQFSFIGHTCMHTNSRIDSNSGLIRLYHFPLKVAWKPCIDLVAQQSVQVCTETQWAYTDLQHSGVYAIQWRTQGIDNRD